MFCDLVGSTVLARELDPEDLHAVLRRCHATWKEVAERHGGYVARHLGDGVLVYFGFPSAHEDDAERAALAGLDIIEAAAPYAAEVREKHGVDFNVRVGINTGLVVVDGKLIEKPVLREMNRILAVASRIATETASY